MQSAAVHWNVSNLTCQRPAYKQSVCQFLSVFTITSDGKIDSPAESIVAGNRTGNFYLNLRYVLVFAIANPSVVCL